YRAENSTVFTCSQWVLKGTRSHRFLALPTPMARRLHFLRASAIGIRPRISLASPMCSWPPIVFTRWLKGQPDVSPLRLLVSSRRQEKSPERHLTVKPERQGVCLDPGSGPGRQPGASASVLCGLPDSKGAVVAARKT